MLRGFFCATGEYPLSVGPVVLRKVTGIINANWEKMFLTCSEAIRGFRSPSWSFLRGIRLTSGHCQGIDLIFVKRDG